MRNYTPFPERELSDITASDLDNLKSVKEGWYVEYKRELNNAKSIAKSVSSFSNTYGGWLFYGVQEKGGGDNTMECCPGIHKDNIDAVLQRIRQGVAANLNPVPHFEFKIITGPELSIGLPDEHVVVCLYIPFSVIAPHVHSSGCIYRRVDDSSEPRAETDRHQLDMLWRRRDEIDKEYSDWVHRKPELSTENAERPYLRLLLDADIYLLEGKSWDLSADEVMSLMNEQDSGPAMLVDACFPSDRGLVARQTTSLSSHSEFGFTWIIGRGLRNEIWIPLNIHETIGDTHYVSGFNKYESTQKLYDLLDKSNAKYSRVVDLSQLFYILLVVVRKYYDLLDKNGTPKSRFHAKIVMCGVLHSVPYIDSPILIQRMERLGLPICLNNEVMVPGGFGADDFYELESSDETLTKDTRFILPTASIMELVCQALGLRVFFGENLSGEVRDLLHELEEAGRRSAKTEAE